MRGLGDNLCAQKKIGPLVFWLCLEELNITVGMGRLCPEAWRMPLQPEELGPFEGFGRLFPGLQPRLCQET